MRNFRKNNGWKPSKSQKEEFAAKMTEIDDFCSKNGISRSGGSYYFSVNGKNYRVSNHSVESSNARARNWAGEQIRQPYHPDGRRDDTVYIHAGLTRIIEIYTALVEGKELDGRGNEIV